METESTYHSRFNALLLFLPVAVLFRHSIKVDPPYVFFSAALTIIPLTRVLSVATERLAERFGESIGGFLNATFGNAPELIISAIAIQSGFHDLVKASITGSIIGNILLVFGCGAIAAGFKYPVLRFNRSTCGIATTMLALAAVGLVLPAMFRLLHPKMLPELECKLGLYISIVLMLTYILNLVFALKTHRHLYAGIPMEQDTKKSALDTKVHESKERKSPDCFPWGAFGILAVSALLIGWMSEILVSSVEGAAREMGFSELFMGVIFLAIINNASEHSIAIVMALKNKMDLAINITVGSSIQIALFVAPALVFMSYFIGPTPMNLSFTPLEVLSIFIAVGTIALTSHDGDVNWIEGVQLVAVYIMLAIAFYFFPA